MNGERTPTGKHLFDVACKKHDIEHRLIKPRHPQTNGMVERFNGRIEEVLKQTRFAGAKELETTIKHYEKLYNCRIPQKMIGHRTPLDALRKWQKERPELFVKKAYNLAGADNYSLKPTRLHRRGSRPELKPELLFGCRERFPTFYDQSSFFSCLLYGNAV